MDFRLNAARSSINLSFDLVFDLEARRLKFLGENLPGAGRSKLNELSILGFAKSRPAAQRPDTARRPGGPAARRPGSPVSRIFLSNGKSTRMHRSASGLGVQNGRRRV